MIVLSDEQRVIETKLTTIRTYLTNKFPGYIIRERAYPKLYHTFTVSNIELRRSYGLKVEWSRLSDPRNTPERIWSALIGEFVASSMVSAGNLFYFW